MQCPAGTFATESETPCSTPISRPNSKRTRKITRPIELVASLDDSAKSQELRALLDEIASLTTRVTVIERRDDEARTPSFSIGEPGQPARIRFAGIPMGHEFTSLVLALLQTGGHPVKLDDDVIEQIRALDGDYAFEDVLLAVVPELPGSRAGAERDVADQPAHPSRRDRRRAVPG